jgi:hypothetical protein
MRKEEQGGKDKEGRKNKKDTEGRMMTGSNIEEGCTQVVKY